MKHAWLLLMVWLMGCSSTDLPNGLTCATCDARVDGPTAMVCVDEAFSSETGVAVNAIREWDGALCGKLQFKTRVIDGADAPVDGCDYTVLAVSSTAPWVAEHMEENLAGFADPSIGVAWVIIDKVPAGLTRAVVVHEFGHLLGVKHGEGVMAATLTNECIAAESVGEVE